LPSKLNKEGEMTKRDVMEIAIKVMGLAFLFLFSQSILVAGAAFLSRDARSIGNKTVLILFSCLATLLYLSFALLFLRAGRRIAEVLMSESGKDPIQNREPLAPHAHLPFWVRILGLYFFVSGAVSLVSDFLQAALTVQNTFLWTRLIGHVIQLALALVFILRTKVVTQLVERES
jgi:hypothetical protein